MYHPDALLQIAHRREAELVREAQDCGIPQADPDRNPFPVTSAVVVVTVAILIAVARMFIA